jgi:hypothetical protein
MSELNLLPCPMCGGAPTMRFIGNDHTKTRAITVKCSNPECRIERTDKAFHKDHAWLANVAAEAWNRRATQPASAPAERLPKPTEADIAELVRMSESASIETLRKAVKLAIATLAEFAAEDATVGAPQPGHLGSAKPASETAETRMDAHSHGSAIPATCAVGAPQGQAEPVAWRMVTPEAGRVVFLTDAAEAARFKAMDGREVRPLGFSDVYVNTSGQLVCIYCKGRGGDWIGRDGAAEDEWENCEHCAAPTKPTQPAEREP